MPDHRLARTRSGYEGYVYQPPRPNPPVILDCAQVAKMWRDHYEPETSPYVTFTLNEPISDRDLFVRFMVDRHLKALREQIP